MRLDLVFRMLAVIPLSEFFSTWIWSNYVTKVAFDSSLVQIVDVSTAAHTQAKPSWARQGRHSMMDEWGRLAPCWTCSGILSAPRGPSSVVEQLPHSAPRPPHLDLVVVANGDQHLLITGVESHAVNHVAVIEAAEVDPVVTVPQVPSLVFCSAEIITPL